MTSPTGAVAVPTGPTYSAASPEADIMMDMTGLWAIGRNTIPGHVSELVDALDKISNALDSIRLNWAGASQKEAQDINDRWQACARSLFGTKQQPELGVLNRIAGGVQGAALNMSVAESHIVELWQKYVELLNQLLAGQDTGDSGGGGGGAAPTPPITEV
ncbi:hypothetical protein [Micromonospora sp. NPDC092111]|uniref:hypothetical protein n=1 Tax=Micromonospora sp. NPDC092111 TaxID=3364289 RepID=UPI00380FB694